MLGNNPVAAVFAREITPGLTSLVKKLEQQQTSGGSKTKAFVVLLSDDDKAEGKLKDLAKSEKIENVMLTIDNPTGPPKLKIAKDADVTVVLYVQKKVAKTLAFEKGKLDEKAAEEVATAAKEHGAAAPAPKKKAK
jgi:hypothetical protein